jgi:hypothetical protein
MTITPTNQGSLIAGIGMWALAWATVFKLDKIPIVKSFFNKEKVFDWISDNSTNKSLTLIITEFINFAIHGVSNPNGVIFALGGTMVNAFMIFIGLPYRQRQRRKEHGEQLLRGIK